MIKRILPNFGILCFDSSFGVKFSEVGLFGGIEIPFDDYIFFDINSLLAKLEASGLGSFGPQ